MEHEHEHEEIQNEEQKESLLEKYVDEKVAKNIRDDRKSDVLEVLALGIIANQHSTITNQRVSKANETFGKILTDCYSWWKGNPKFIRGVMGWIIVLWPFFITFTAAGGDNIINSIIDKIFPTNDTVNVICNFEGRNHTSGSDCDGES